MRLRNFVAVMGLTALAIPAVTFADDPSFDSLMAQVPAPPKTVAEADGRWQEGHSENGSQVGFDKSAVDILSQLDSLMQSGLQDQKIGGEKAQDVKGKMENMTQDEKVAYAMQLASKMQKDQTSAYTGSNAKAMQKAATNGASPKSKSFEVAAKQLSLAETAYKSQVQALTAKMSKAVQACPESQGPGGMNQRDMGCAQPLLDKYKADYKAVTEKYLAKVGAIYAQFKTAATAENKAAQADIATLQSSGSDTAQNEIDRRKIVVYGTLKGLAQVADQPVNHSHEAATVDPKISCGPNCDLPQDAQ